MVNETVPQETPDVSDLDARLDGDLSISAAELITEIAARHKARQPPEDAFNLKDYSALTGVEIEVARNLLEKEVECGFLLTDRPVRNGPRYWWRNPDFVNSP